MTNGGNISDQFFMMVTDSTVNVDVFGNITRGNGSSIDDCNSLWGL
jgi:hypothetical protein